MATHFGVVQIKLDVFTKRLGAAFLKVSNWRNRSQKSKFVIKIEFKDCKNQKSGKTYNAEIFSTEAYG
jgi:hypothetical protein